MTGTVSKIYIFYLFSVLEFFLSMKEDKANKYNTGHNKKSIAREITICMWTFSCALIFAEITTALNEIHHSWSLNLSFLLVTPPIVGENSTPLTYYHTRPTKIQDRCMNPIYRGSKSEFLSWESMSKHRLVSPRPRLFPPTRFSRDWR